MLRIEKRTKDLEQTLHTEYAREIKIKAVRTPSFEELENMEAKQIGLKKEIDYMKYLMEEVE